MHPGDPASYLLRKDFSGKPANVPVGVADRRHPRPRSSKTIPDSLGVVLSAAANEGVERRVNPEYLRSILLLHASRGVFGSLFARCYFCFALEQGPTANSSPAAGTVQILSWNSAPTSS